MTVESLQREMTFGRRAKLGQSAVVPSPARAEAGTTRRAVAEACSHWHGASTSGAAACPEFGRVRRHYLRRVLPGSCSGSFRRLDPRHRRGPIMRGSFDAPVWNGLAGSSLIRSYVAPDCAARAQRMSRARRNREDGRRFVTYCASFGEAEESGICVGSIRSARSSHRAKQASSASSRRRAMYRWVVATWACPSQA